MRRRDGRQGLFPRLPPATGAATPTSPMNSVGCAERRDPGAQRCDPEVVSNLKQRPRNREERCRQGSRDNPPLYPDSRGKPAKPSSFVFEVERSVTVEKLNVYEYFW